MKSLPSQFKGHLELMNNFRKAPIRVLPTSTTADVKGGGVIKFLLPVGAVLDLKSWNVNFSASTLLGNAPPAVSGTAGSARIVGFPKYMQSLIQTYEIWVNNRQLVCINEFGRVYALLQDFKANRSRKLGNNADPSVYSYMSNDLATNVGLSTFRPAAATGDQHVACNQFKGEYCIDEWLGFLSPLNNSILDTNLLGQIEIVLRLYPGNQVLWGSKDNAALDGTESLDYILSNIVGYIDKIDFKDELYYNAMASMVSEQGGLKVAYKNYTYFAGDAATASKAVNMRVTENCASLDNIFFTFYDNTGAAITARQPLQVSSDEAFSALVAKHDSTLLLNSSIYYNRNGWGVGTVEFEINSQPITGPLSITQQWEETLKCFGLNEPDDLKNINPGIRDLNHYKKNFYVCGLSTSHINNRDPSVNYISGIDTQSTSMQISVRTTQDPNNAWDAVQSAIPVIITEYTSWITISGARQILPTR